MKRSRENWAAAFLREFWLLLIPALALLPFFNSFPFPGSGSQFSDFAVTHFPNARFLQHAIFENHTIPLWSPTILSGYPFVAHPYSGIWYLPYWIALLFPLPMGLNLLLALHVVWAGIGMYKLALQQGMDRVSAFFAGVTFQAAPILWAHIGAGHLFLLLAVAWTPWLLWSSAYAKRKNVLARLARPGVVLALIFCVDPRWAVYACLVWVGYVLWLEKKIFPVLLSCAKQFLLAIALAAPAVWFYTEYALLSTRASLTSGEILAFSLPPAGLLGLLVPQQGGFHEWIVYPGIIVLLLAVVGTISERKKYGIWPVVILVSLLLALGSNIPGMDQLTELPGFSQLRVPTRALLLAALAFSILAGLGLQKILRTAQSREVRLAAFFLATFSLSFAILGIVLRASVLRLGFLSFCFIVAFMIVLELYGRKRIKQKILIGFVFALALVDMMFMDISLVRYKGADEVISEDATKADFLASQPGLFRVYSPSYSLSQQTSAEYELQLADGVDPLQLASYATYMNSASGVPAAGYSVSMPPIAGDPVTANAQYRPDLEALGLLNVKFIVSEFKLVMAGLNLAKEINGSFVYENQLVRPRAWVEDGSDWHEVDEIAWNYNQIAIRAEGPGTLVLSELAYPGWRASIDGKPASLEVSRGLFRSVSLGEGDHQVTFLFRPLALYVGPLASLLVILGLLFWPVTKRK